MRTKNRIKQSVEMHARTRTARVGLPARHEVEILPSTARTRTPNAVRDSLSERLIARKGARPPMGKEESVPATAAMLQRFSMHWCRCAADICGVRLGARLEAWGRDDECVSACQRLGKAWHGLALVQGYIAREAPPPRTMYGAMRAEGRNSGKDFAHPKLSRIHLFTARASLGSAKAKLRESLAVEQNSALTMRVVEQAQWGGTRKSVKYKKRGGDIREDLYPNVLHFSVSADAYPLPKYARPGRGPPLETWGHVNIHEVWIPLAKVVCCVRRALCWGTRSRSEATAGIGARKYGRREDSGHAGHKVIK
ncbi:hypothetical protein B0H13DRAFT_2278095 [Mycena leptocephala]|nr:hypothetical protein B0H13DRAFT_2278095 [Mycena leptocephala]